MMVAENEVQKVVKWATLDAHWIAKNFNGFLSVWSVVIDIQLPENFHTERVHTHE